MDGSTIEVRPNEVAGWDVLHEDQQDAVTNVATKEEAVRAAELLAEEAGGSRVVVRDDPHELSDTGRGVKFYVIALLGLLAAITVLIVATALLSSALNI
jgi:hypothetical protein